MDQNVTVGGIVTAVGFSGDKFFIGDRTGGAWSGIYVYNFTPVSLGDSVEVIGRVQEYNNLTELSSATVSIKSSGNPLPEPSLLTCADFQSATVAEMWEGVLVKIIDVNCSAPVDSYGEFRVRDETNVSTYVSDGFISHAALNPQIGDYFISITGMVDYSFGTYRLAPRSATDIVQPSINIPEITLSEIGDFEIPILTYVVEDTEDVIEYDFTLSFDPSNVSIYGYKLLGSLTEEFDGEVSLEYIASNQIKINCLFGSPLINEENNALLITLLGEAKTYGSSSIDFVSFKYNDMDATRVTGTTISIPFKLNKAYLNIYNDNNKKNIFNPSLNEKITIVYGARVNGSMSNSKVRVRIYDAMGRHQATLIDRNVQNSIGVETATWDGKTTNHRLLPPGTYICHVEVIDRKTGEKQVTTQPIVIAAEL
jgi:FlaG/FlaF family flagellin (archaellin)